MPRVVITHYRYALTKQDALRVAREARMMGKRSEIITDEEYERDVINGKGQQDLVEWAKKEGLEF